MAEKQYGGAIPVNMNPIFTHIATKIRADVDALKEMLETTVGIHDFEAQHKLMGDIQAGVRATNVLDGKVTHGGETIPLVQTKVPQPAQKINVDMGAIGQAIDMSKVTTNQLTDEQKAA